MLVDVGLQNRVEVLELDVANQSDDEDLKGEPEGFKHPGHQTPSFQIFFSRASPER